MREHSRIAKSSGKFTIICYYRTNTRHNCAAISPQELDILSKMKHYVPISAHKEWNLDGLLETVWEYLDLVRIYTKPRGVNPDYEDPVVLPRRACTVEDCCYAPPEQFARE